MTVPLTRDEVEKWPPLGPFVLDPARVLALLNGRDEARAEADALRKLMPATEREKDVARIAEAFRVERNAANERAARLAARVTELGDALATYAQADMGSLADAHDTAMRVLAKRDDAAEVLAARDRREWTRAVEAERALFVAELCGADYVLPKATHWEVKRALAAHDAKVAAEVAMPLVAHVAMLREALQLFAKNTRAQGGYGIESLIDRSCAHAEQALAATPADVIAWRDSVRREALREAINHECPLCRRGVPFRSAREGALPSEHFEQTCIVDGEPRGVVNECLARSLRRLLATATASETPCRRCAFEGDDPKQCETTPCGCECHGSDR